MILSYLPTVLFAQSSLIRDSDNFLDSSSWTDNQTKMLFPILLGFATLATSTANCYYPSGKVSGSVPCNSTTTGYSSCCASGHLCMSSGLCFTRGLISRGSCTDPTWKDPACAQYCLDCTFAVHISFPNQAC
jgi:hypothetical protein